MVNQSARETRTIRTAIKPDLKSATLRRGGWIAGAGAVILLLGGTFLPLAYLKYFGLPIFFGGLMLISIGWLPYRKLQRLELQPHTLTYDGAYYLFAKEGKPLFRIPEKSVAKLEYEEKEEMYGMAVWLKKPVEEKIAILQARVNVETYLGESAQHFPGCDLFFPYFSEASVKHLLESDHAS